MTCGDPDLELDALQPSFFPDEDDIYFSGLDWSRPGDDLWKKFDLLPMPLPSPGLDFPCPAPEVSPSEWDAALGLGEPGDERSSSPVLLRDCMWSTFSPREMLQRAVTATTPAKRQGTVAAPAPATPSSSSSGGDDDHKAPSISGEETAVTRFTITIGPKNAVLVTGTGQSSVLVLKGCVPIRLQPGMLSPSSSSSSGAEGDSPPPAKTARGGDAASRPPIKIVIPAKLDGPLRNVMEFQRRNNLRSSFFRLRLEVPDVANNERATKLAILTKGIEYVRALQAEEQRLLQEKERLQARQQRLLKRIENAWPHLRARRSFSRSCGKIRKRLPRPGFQGRLQRAADGHLEQPACSSADSVAAAVPSEPCRPARPVAYVKPMRCETPAPAEAARTAGRGRRRGGGSPPPPEPAGRRRGGAGRRRGWAGRLMDPIPLVQPEWHAQLQHPGQYGELYGGHSMLSFPFAEVGMLARTVQLGPGAPQAWPELGFQELHHVQAYGAVLGQPGSALCPSMSYQPVAGSAMQFLQTSFGTYMPGAPLSFTHTAL
ncbi:PREDICTED: N-myc proto-oncogene protein-like [Propithecus coquereli]|uniref:N-myc proto-oncogene protein-like n=1 Tax=Propithecus coquereli TaxID=379532 RepID=UPI00063F145A|nr:PREDICTED: N-myc proto-oncogene protein-like [Propithecus coquereli]